MSFSTLHGLLTGAYAAHALRPALRGRGVSLSYGQLALKAGGLARRLLSLGVGPGEPVLIYSERSPAAVVAVHGVLLAGAAYVPVDAQMPWLRLCDIARDCGAKVLLSSAALLSGRRLPKGLRAVALDREAWAAAAPPAAKVSPGQNAYVLYTSGTTGRPKGIVHSHASARAFIDWAAGEFELSSRDRVANLAPFQFDLSVFDLFNTCRAGALLLPIPYPDSLFSSRIAEFLRKNRVTAFYTVPSVLAGMQHQGALKAGSLPRLRRLLFAGEVMPPKTLRAWLAYAPAASFFNLYGPTETNVCLWHRVRRQTAALERPVPIGRPLPGTTLKLLGPGGKPAVKGELFVAGPTVMTGYLGDRSATKQAFKGAFYRTGDIVSLGPDREYLYWGREDDQVKIRGYRVELKEVEAALAALPQVAEAAVAVRQEEGQAVLVAYVVPHRGRRTAAERLFEALALKLPRYMLPVRIEVVRRLARLVSGKVDRRALSGSPGQDEVRAEVRALLVDKILRGQTVEDTESFWETGALDSLDLLQLAHHLEAAFGVKVVETDVDPVVFGSVEAITRYIWRKL